MRFVLHCKCEFVLVLCTFGILPLLVLYFIAKPCNVAWFATKENIFLHLATKVDCPLYFDTTPLPRLRLRAPSPCALTSCTSNKG